MSESPKLEQADFFDKLTKEDGALEVEPRTQVSLPASTPDRLTMFSLEELHEMQDKASEGGWSNGYSASSIQQELTRRDSSAKVLQPGDSKASILSPSELNGWLKQMQDLVRSKNRRTND